MALVTQSAYAATEFVCAIRQSGGDYSLLSSWVAANQCDLTAAFTTGWDNPVGSIVDGAAVTWGTDGVGTLKHMTTVAKSGADTFLLVKTSGSNPVDNNVVTDGANSFVVNGTPDSAIAVAECYDDWPSGLADTVTISGFDTGANNYVKITVPVGERHSGTLPDGTGNQGFMLKPSSGTDVISNIADYTVIEWVAIDGTNTTGDGIVLGNYLNYSSDYAKVRNSIIANAGDDGIQVYNRQAAVELYNNIIYNATDDGILLYHMWTTSYLAYLYNNTIYGSGGDGITYGVDVYDYSVYKNNISYNNTGSDFVGGVGGSDYNFSEDDTAPGDNSIHGTTDGKAPDFV
ncbi:MAG: right-handed parallel beta-helix repeat-containing protein, partial [Candidatus Omnitrophota bacterium]